MGYGVASLKLMVELKRRGLLDNYTSVIELGSQEIVNLTGDKFLRKFLNEFGAKDIDGAIEEFFRTQREQKYTGAEWAYKNTGFKEYASIDADGKHNALVFDLNRNLKRDYNFEKQYDLVTNHGTTEHVFDVASSFANIHNLCKKGGMMIHGLPFQGYVYHSFYNFMPNFYTELCAANGYRMVGCFINFSPAANRLYEVSPKYIGLLTFTDALLFYALIKETDEEFKYPYDGYYRKASQLYKADGAKHNDICEPVRQKKSNIVKLVFVSMGLSVWANTLKCVNFFVTMAKALVKCAT